MLDMNAMMEQLKKLDKLDEIAKTLAVIDQKVTNIDTRQLKTEEKVENIEKSVRELEVKVSASTKNEKRMMLAIRQAEIHRIKSEENGRKYNILINNYAQTDMDEDRKKTVEIVKEVLANVLKIRGGRNIVIKNAHRIPASKGVKPIIFKVNTMCDKQLIWDHLSNLKTYNESQPDNSKIYIDMNNLPAKLNRDKKTLREKYKQLRADQKSPKWFYDKSKGECCIKVDGRRIYSTTDNFDFKLVETEEVVKVNNAWNIPESPRDDEDEFE